MTIINLDGGGGNREEKIGGSSQGGKIEGPSEREKNEAPSLGNKLNQGTSLPKIILKALRVLQKKDCGEGPDAC